LGATENERQQNSRKKNPDRQRQTALLHESQPAARGVCSAWIDESMIEPLLIRFAGLAGSGHCCQRQLSDGCGLMIVIRWLWFDGYGRMAGGIFANAA